LSAGKRTFRRAVDDYAGENSRRYLLEHAEARDTLALLRVQTGRGFGMVTTDARPYRRKTKDLNRGSEFHTRRRFAEISTPMPTTARRQP
jgi:hypothetical protein